MLPGLLAGTVVIRCHRSPRGREGDKRRRTSQGEGVGYHTPGAVARRGQRALPFTSTSQPAGREAEVASGSAPTSRSPACPAVQLAVSSPLSSPQVPEQPAPPSDRSGVPPICLPSVGGTDPRIPFHNGRHVRCTSPDVLAPSSVDIKVELVQLRGLGGTARL